MTDEKTTTPEEAPKAKETSTKKVAAIPATSRKPQGGGNRGRGGKRGFRKREPKEFEESIINIDRVTRVTKGGRQMRFRVSIVIGNKKGKVGFGIGKSSEVMLGVQKAVANAKKNLITVPIFEDSLPHEIIGKFKASTILLFPAPEGKGVIAGGAVRKVLELAGIKNVLSKMHGSRNGINSTYATMNALSSLQNRVAVKKEDVEPAKDEKVEAVEVPKKKAATKKSVTKKATKSASDDLTKIEGIGPKIAEHLNNEGIKTFVDLAKAKIKKIQEVLDNAGPKYKVHDPKTWPEQASMAADGKWDELKKWQDELDGGK